MTKLMLGSDARASDKAPSKKIVGTPKEYSSSGPDLIIVIQNDFLGINCRCS